MDTKQAIIAIHEEEMRLQKALTDAGYNVEGIKANITFFNPLIINFYPSITLEYSSEDAVGCLSLRDMVLGGK